MSEVDGADHEDEFQGRKRAGLLEHHVDRSIRRRQVTAVGARSGELVDQQHADLAVGDPTQQRRIGEREGPLEGTRRTGDLSHSIEADYGREPSVNGDASMGSDHRTTQGTH